MSLVDSYFGVLQLCLVIAGTVFSVMFILHVLFTPDEAKLRKIIREEIKTHSLATTARKEK